MSFQAGYRVLPRLQMSGNYMLSYSRGSVEAEDAATITAFSDANQFPEYRQPSWNSPVGYLSSDQRHKVRIWSTYDLPTPKEMGRFALGLMQRFDSGGPYSQNMTVDSRPYVTNPGYLLPPSTVPYFVSGRGEFRFNSVWRTDMSLNWTHKVPLPKLPNAEIFLRAVTNNIFNNLRVDSFNTTIIGRSGDSTLTAFNPFTTKPVEGVNYSKGPSFGQASNPSSYQSPRDVYFSVGFRF